MRILYIEINSASDHLNYNNGILRNIDDSIAVDICAAEGYINSHIIHYSHYYSLPDNAVYNYDKIKKNRRYEFRKRAFIAYRWINKYIDLNSYDLIIYGYTEIITFALCRCNTNSRVAFADHLIGDVITNRVKRFFFTHIPPKYEFIAFEQYIKDYLLKYSNGRKIWVIKHPLPSRMALKKNIVHGKYIIFAPAVSNDEKFVQEMITFSALIPAGMQIIIRSKEQNLKTDKLIVYNKHISNEEYLDTFSKTSAVLIDYGTNYNYRTSGVLFEALQSRTPVILHDNNTLVYYAQKYPEVIVTYHDTISLLQSLNTEEYIQLFNIQGERFDRVLNDYSEESLKQELKELFDDE